MADFLPIEQHYLRLAKKPINSSVVFTNEENKMLLVKPTYLNQWLLPGGSNEIDESPYQAAKREVMEELGLDLPVERLLTVDYYLSDGVREQFSFIFYGGTLDKETIAKFTIPKKELSEYGFYNLEEVKKLMSKRASDRIPLVIKALKSKEVIYLDHGKEL